MKTLLFRFKKSCNFSNDCRESKTKNPVLELFSYMDVLYETKSIPKKCISQLD